MLAQLILEALSVCKNGVKIVSPGYLYRALTVHHFSFLILDFSFQLALQPVTPFFQNFFFERTSSSRPKNIQMSAQENRSLKTFKNEDDSLKINEEETLIEDHDSLKRKIDTLQDNSHASKRAVQQNDDVKNVYLKPKKIHSPQIGNEHQAIIPPLQSPPSSVP